MARKAASKGSAPLLPKDPVSSARFIDTIIAKGVITGRRMIVWLPVREGGEKRYDMSADLAEATAEICRHMKIPLPLATAS